MDLASVLFTRNTVIGHPEARWLPPGPALKVADCNSRRDCGLNASYCTQAYYKKMPPMLEAHAQRKFFKVRDC